MIKRFRSKTLERLGRFEVKKISIKKITLIGVIIFANLLVLGISLHTLANSSSILIKDAVMKSEFTPHDLTTKTIAELEQQIAIKKEQERVAEEDRLNTEKVENILSRYNSPMKGYGGIMVKKARECGGGDYRIIVAISGNESGFGRIPYKLYNPFGYLDGVQYSGWEESLSVISCKIMQRFIIPCNNDLVCIVRTYGGSDTDKEQWVKNIQWFINQI